MEPAGAARHGRAGRQAEASESIPRRAYIDRLQFRAASSCTLAFSEGGRDFSGTIPRRLVERSETSLFLPLGAGPENGQRFFASLRMTFVESRDTSCCISTLLQEGNFDR